MKAYVLIYSKYHFNTTLPLHSHLIPIHISKVSRYDLNNLTVKGLKTDSLLVSRVHQGFHISHAMTQLLL